MIRYSLRQLRYFVACCDTGSVAGAAAILNISQPSVSVALSKLEEELGVQLLIRHHAQGVTPSVQGQRLLPAARQLLRDAGEFQAEAQQSAQTLTGELRLCSFVTLAPTYLPSLVKQVTLSHPGISLRLGEGSQDQIVADLRQGKYDMALMYNLALPDDLTLTPLVSLPPHVILPQDHRLACDAPISLTELEGEPFVVFDVDPSRAFFTGILKSAGVTPKVAHASPSLELVRGMVACGLGYSLLVTRPKSDHTYDGTPLCIRSIIEDAPKSPIVLAQIKGLKPTRVMKAFTELARRYFKTLQA